MAYHMVAKLNNIAVKSADGQTTCVLVKCLGWRRYSTLRLMLRELVSAQRLTLHPSSDSAPGTTSTLPADAE